MLRLRFPTGRRVAWAHAWVLMAGMLCALPASAADPDALWKLVHNKCVPNQRRHHNPAPCEQVVLRHGVARGFVLLKDLNGATQYLVIPTARVTGIEDPAVLAPGATNYWRDALIARRFTQALAGRIIARDELSLAVNSMYGRSQNQLHIHVDCIRADVRAALKAKLDQIGPAWAAIDVGVSGRHYEAMRLAGDELGARNPFRLLADGDPAARAEMGLETLLLAPVSFADGAPGFVLLADRASPGDAGSAEELQDHDCKVLQSGG
jgi:CDP-diacylglycerol pyrophosphatase